MKKIYAVLLSLMVLMSFSSCSGTSTDAGDNQIQNTSNTKNVTQGTNESSNKENVNKQTVFDEITVVDNDECSIKITGIDPDNFWGYSLNVLLENKSPDKTYMFSTESASVNNVQTETMFASEVAPGKKSNGNISFTDSTLKENGIDEFTDIELSFRVYDSNDWLAEAVAQETIHIYPLGEENAVSFIRVPRSTDNVIIDNESVTVTVTGYKNDNIWGYTVNLFIQNKTDKNIMCSTEETSVNGYMLDPFFAKSVSAGKCAFSSMTWANSSLSDNGISEVSEIEFKMKVYDANNWFDDYFANDIIVLKP